VITPDGRKLASELAVGDKLMSVRSAQLPDGFVPDNWINGEFSIDEVVETEIVSITSEVSEKAFVVNGDIYSPSHHILVREGDEYTFKFAKDISVGSYIYSFNDSEWVAVIGVTEINYIDMVYSINCEPYDMFFTENALVYDSVPDNS
jgi:hypothetical protein